MILRSDTKINMHSNADSRAGVVEYALKHLELRFKNRVTGMPLVVIRQCWEDPKEPKLRGLLLWSRCHLPHD